MTDDLTAAVARLREQCREHRAGAWLESDVRLVLAALEAAQSDAARYLWLRDSAPGTWAPWADERDDSAPHEIDAAIDAATKGSGDDYDSVQKGRDMTPDLSALESLLAKATPGPWRNERTGDEETVMRIIHGRRSAGGSEVCIVTTGSYNDATEAGNAALIAAAVNALPALIARVRELEQERDEARTERDALRECVRAADAMALECRRVGLISSTWLEDYDDARAAWKGEGQ